MWFLFFFYYYFKNKFDVHINKDLNNLISGGLAGITSWTITYPIDTIKTRIQSKHISFSKAIKQYNLFKGLSVSLLRAFIVNSVGFYTYEYFNKKL